MCGNARFLSSSLAAKPGNEPSAGDYAINRNRLEGLTADLSGPATCARFGAVVPAGCAASRAEGSGAKRGSARRSVKSLGKNLGTC